VRETFMEPSTEAETSMPATVMPEVPSVTRTTSSATVEEAAMAALGSTASYQMQMMISRVAQVEMETMTLRLKAGWM
jgi:hypothetical protein